MPLLGQIKFKMRACFPKCCYILRQRCTSVGIRNNKVIVLLFYIFCFRSKNIGKIALLHIVGNLRPVVTRNRADVIFFVSDKRSEEWF